MRWAGKPRRRYPSAAQILLQKPAVAAITVKSSRLTNVVNHSEGDMAMHASQLGLARAAEASPAALQKAATRAMTPFRTPPDGRRSTIEPAVVFDPLKDAR